MFSPASFHGKEEPLEEDAIAENEDLQADEEPDKARWSKLSPKAA